VKLVSGVTGVCLDRINTNGIGLNGVTGVAGKTGAGGDRVVDHVEEVFVHGIERVRVPPQIPSQSHVTSFV